MRFARPPHTFLHVVMPSISTHVVDPVNGFASRRTCVFHVPSSKSKSWFCANTGSVNASARRSFFIARWSISGWSRAIATSPGECRTTGAKGGGDAGVPTQRAVTHPLEEEQKKAGRRMKVSVVRRRFQRASSGHGNLSHL